MEVQEVSCAFEIAPAAWAQQAVGADFGEAAGEDVLEESCEEGVHRECDTARFTGAGVRVAEGDVVLLEAFDAVVGERDAVDVAREIEQGVLAGADLLHVDGPPLIPDGGIDLLIQAGAGERGMELHAKDA